jgi:hypothetical protein
MEFATEADKLLSLKLEGTVGLKWKNILKIENLNASIENTQIIKRL